MAHLDYLGLEQSIVFYSGVQIYNFSLDSITGLMPSAYSAPYHGKQLNCNDHDAEIADCAYLLATGCADNRDEVAIQCVPRPGQQTVATGRIMTVLKQNMKHGTCMFYSNRWKVTLIQSQKLH